MEPILSRLARRLCLASGLALVLRGPVEADTLSVNPTDDRRGIDSLPLDNVFSLQPEVNVETVTFSPPGFEERAGLEFDISAIPSGSSIISAMLAITVSFASTPQSAEVHGYQGNGVIENADLSTLNLLAPFTVNGPGAVTINLPAGFFQSLVDQSAAFAGLTLRNITLPGGAFSYKTNEFPTSAERPLLTVEYTTNPNQPPDCSLAHLDPAAGWPPNHKLKPVQVLGVTDPDGDPVVITVTGITQDEPVKEQGAGSGMTCPDGVFLDLDENGSADAAALRQERAGKGNGRVYRVSFTAADGQGGECSSSATFCVPQDQRPGVACVEGSQDFDSTVCPPQGGGAEVSPPDPRVYTLAEVEALTPEPLFLRGDLNFDGVWDLSDAVRLLDRLFRDHQGFACADAADLNDDGQVDVSDGISLLTHLFSASDPRSIDEVLGSLGPDLTADTLGCE
jgi:hypothetical protein